MNQTLESEPISSLTGKEARVYTTGDFLTQDHRPERVNIELSPARDIVRIWMG
ncbi:hypothetical protein L1F30_02595 [Simiduia sp. 21SJ11W-1]|uniref:hypothetical protein n=1 Tax=Simiduia sp. 21SJ11W-1 TaxID=2909669 RepID=UPI0020A1BF5F|nr:hypothetical protein [Simiduia sp. 21SJ11W-1]UTA48443.1 hypothetical protein L1F30_02595 [Simiduia sp. 21SJ11W-1]